MRAIQVREFGGPEVLEPVTLPDPVAAAGTSLIEVSAVGVNFADTHRTEDSYLAPSTLPYVPGSEVAGVLAGTDDRVAALVADGGYAERVAAPDALTFALPDEVDDVAAVALLVQGMTAWHLLTTCTRLVPGESVVVHAAAGGVGSLAVQLARHLGAGRVIATASTEDKLAIARELGAHAGVRIAPDADADSIAAALREANGGRGIDVVLEMVGGPTFDASLASLARFGRLATFGAASRTPPTPVAPGRLMVGSATITGFWLADAMTPGRVPTMIRAVYERLLGLVVDGALHPRTGPNYALADARRAHEDLRARRTTGKVVLDPRLEADGR